MLIALTLAAPLAFAGEVEMWSYNSFPNGDDVDGHEGWKGGYATDPWLGYDGTSGNWALAARDDSADGTEYGNGTALDNYLVNEAVPVSQGKLTVTTWVDGNDAWGIVIGSRGRGEWVMYLMCGSDGSADALCPPVDDESLSPPWSAIVSVHDGIGEVLAVSDQTSPEQEVNDLSLSINDGTLTAHAQVSGDTLTAAVPEGVDVDAVGFYSYNQGNEPSYGPTFFQLPTLVAFDDDDDGVIDDDDNCEKDANPGQEDGDGDGIGAACDPDEGGGDTDTDTDADTDADGDTDTDTDTDGGQNVNAAKADLLFPGSCGCASSSSSASLVALALGALALRRRRA